MSMRRFLSVVVALAIVCCVRADDKKDQEAIQGKWTIVSVERDGKADPRWTNGLRVMEGDKYTLIPSEGAPVTGTFKLDSSKTPKAFDFVPGAGQFKGKTLAGIYSLEGDTLKICFATEEGKPRPTEFASRPGSSTMLAIHKKAK
jgi:uncharacterized protein (TIGR03067 family)